MQDFVFERDNGHDLRSVTVTVELAHPRAALHDLRVESQVKAMHVLQELLADIWMFFKQMNILSLPDASVNTEKQQRFME